MTSTNVGHSSIERQLRGLGERFVLTDLGKTDECLTHVRLLQIAGQAPEYLDASTRYHVNQCPRCAHLYARYRSSYCMRRRNDRWNATLAIDTESSSAADLSLQILGFLGLDDHTFIQCDELDDWLKSPLHLRVNLVLESEFDLFSLTLLDVPPTVAAVTLRTPNREFVVTRVEDELVFELMEPLSSIASDVHVSCAGEAFLNWLSHGKIRLEFEMKTAAVDDVRESWTEGIVAVLKEVEAIERCYDYELPSGLHTDTHINPGRVCESDDALSVVAEAFDELFRDITFDTVVANGWAMTTVARRLAWRRTSAVGNKRVHNVMCEGYEHLTFSGDILPDDKVLVLIDVNVTGSLVRRITDQIMRAGSEVVGVGALVQPLSRRATRYRMLRSLCDVDMDIADPDDHCSRCHFMERRVFNPVSCCMTKRAPDPRSPSEFLAQNPHVRAFWDSVNLVGAYEHHRKEGNTHYLAFVDTKKLLEHAEVGPNIIAQLCDRLLETQFVPEVVLIPNRARSMLLAQMILTALSARWPDTTIVKARKRRLRKIHNGDDHLPWSIPTSVAQGLRGAKVLIVDTGVGHGNTIDCLAQIAKGCRASAVGAAVLLSRLPDGCEKALGARLNAGFHTLFHLPVKPVLVRGTNASLCPICQRKQAIQDVGRESGIDALQHWTEHFRRSYRRHGGTTRMVRDEEVQLRLFADPGDFFRTCRQSVASGVTLHALSASMTNGMAALILPEILDGGIPSRTRTAMIENLSPGALEWSGDVLQDDLRQVLAKSTNPNVWRASAELMARNGYSEWFDHTGSLLTRLNEEGRHASLSFWNHIACTAQITALENPAYKEVMRKRIEELKQDVTGTSAGEGLQLVHDVLSV